MTYLQFILFPVDDDGSDLLVHEDEDGTQEGRNQSCQGCPPGVVAEWADQPLALGVGGLQ